MRVQAWTLLDYSPEAIALIGGMSMIVCVSDMDWGGMEVALDDGLPFG